MTEEMVVAVLGSLAISPILFFGIKLRGSFWMFWFQYVLGVFVGLCFGYFFSAIAPTMDAANAMLPTKMLFNMFLAVSC